MNFLQHVLARSTKAPASDCIVWTGAVTSGGYGRSIVAQRIHGTSIVHRAVYQELNGRVPRGMYVCHRCDNPPCVNPTHLFIGTPSDNAQDRSKKGRNAPRQGSASGRAKLNEQKVREIRRLLRDGADIADLAARHGVSYSAISHIKHRHGWRHVE